MLAFDFTTQTYLTFHVLISIMCTFDELQELIPKQGIRYAEPDSKPLLKMDLESTITWTICAETNRLWRGVCRGRASYDTGEAG